MDFDPLTTKTAEQGRQRTAQGGEGHLRSHQAIAGSHVKLSYGARILNSELDIPGMR